MKFKVLFLVFVFTMFFGLNNALSQEVQFGLDFQVGVPQGEFKDQLDDQLGVGVGGMFGYRFANTPFLVGVDLGFMNFGTETRDEPFSTTIPDVRVEVENSYNLFHGDLLFRVIPYNLAVRPYLDGLVGFNYFFTQTKIRERGRQNADDAIATDTNFRDTTLSYGLGGGVKFRVFSGDTAVNNGEQVNMPYDIHINLGARYMFGREAEYLQPGSIVRDDQGNVEFDVLQSTTDLLHFKIGISVSL